jgi:Tol biopolymer transport system component
VAPLGSGGMGEVYRARDARLGRDVAVKVLPLSFASDPERLARFETEARAAGQLNDPNVLVVYDVGAHDGAPYLVTELLEGESLRERLAEGALPLRKALDLAVQIVRGLAAAHARGIVHRDLKPENLFVTADGRIKILDFGLARVATDPKVDAAAATVLQATNPGVVLGTVGYMSPEQVRAQPADARSDLFAFGAILYEMLTGGRAFQRDSSADTMAAILREDPPEMAGAGSSIPPAIERLIRRCLEKQPDERFQSARDVAFALEALAGGASSSAVAASGGVPAVAAAPRAGRRSGPLLAIVAVAAAAGGFGLREMLGGSGAGGARLAPRLQQITFTGESIGQPSLAPDAGSVAFVRADAKGNDDIYVQRIGGENPVNLTPDSPNDDVHPAFSPDGRQIAFRSGRDGGGIFVMGATGESIRRLTDEGFNPAWSPDGREIVYATEGIFSAETRTGVSKLLRVDVASGARTPLFDGDAVQPSFSPDGRWLTFWGLPAGTGRRVLYSMAAAGGAPNVLVDDSSLNWSPVWSADGRFVYFATDREPPMNIWRIPIDPTTGAAAAAPERVTVSTDEHQGLSGGSGGAFVVAARTTMTEIRRHALDLDTGALSASSDLIWRTARRMSNVAPSPDDTYLAFAVSDPREDLMVMRTDGSAVTRLTSDVYRDRGPAWSADSIRLHFYSDRSGTYQNWSIRRDGSGLEQVLEVASGTPITAFLPSPDGRLGAATALGSDQRLLIVDLSRPLAERVPEAVPLPEGVSAIVPIGWLSDDEVVVSSPGSQPGTSRVFVYAASAKAFRLAADAPAPAVGLMGRRVFGVGADNRIVLVDLDSGRVRRGDDITSRLSPLVRSAAPSATGRSLFVVQTQTFTNLWLLDVGDRPGGR